MQSSSNLQTILLIWLQCSSTSTMSPHTLRRLILLRYSNFGRENCFTQSFHRFVETLILSMVENGAGADAGQFLGDITSCFWWANVSDNRPQHHHLMPVRSAQDHQLNYCVTSNQLRQRATLTSNLANDDSSRSEWLGSDALIVFAQKLRISISARTQRSALRSRRHSSRLHPPGAITAAQLLRRYCHQKAGSVSCCSMLIALL